MTADSAALGTERRWLVAGVATVAVIGGIVGYGLGTWRAGVFEAVGKAYSTQEQISIETGDWSYDVPLDVQWADRDGVWQEGTRPACLPPTGEVDDIRFAAVPVETRDIAFRQVVAVFCD